MTAVNDGGGATTTVARDDLGLTWIGDRDSGSPVDPIDALFRQTLPIPGGSVTIDVRHPRDLEIVVDDLEAASWWLEHLAGRDVADATYSLDESDDVASVEVPLRLGSLATTTSRLIEALWMRRWWPEPVEREWLLDAEIGALAWDTEELLGNLDLAAAILTDDDVRARITEFLAVAVRQGGAIDVGEDPVASVIRRSARAALDATDADAVHQRLREAYAAVAKLESGIQESLDRLLADLASAESSSSTGEKVLAATLGTSPDAEAEPGAGAKTVVHRRLELDPRRVHPRSVDIGADRAAYTVRRHGDEVAVEVFVPADGSTFRDIQDSLIAVVVVDGVSVSELLSRIAGGYVATIRVPSQAAAPTVTVDVRSVHYDLSTHPRLSQLEGGSARDALAGFARSRKDAPASPPFAFERPYPAAN